MSPRAGAEVLSSRLPPQHRTLHLGRRQREPTTGASSRLRPAPDRHRSAVCMPATRSASISMPASMLSIRPPSISASPCFPWAKVPYPQGRRQDAYHCSICTAIIPAILSIFSDGKLHDVHALGPHRHRAWGLLCDWTAGLSRFRAALYRFTLGSAFFVTRSKKNVLLQRRYSQSGGQEHRRNPRIRRSSSPRSPRPRPTPIRSGA